MGTGIFKHFPDGFNVQLCFRTRLHLSCISFLTIISLLPTYRRGWKFSIFIKTRIGSDVLEKRLN